MTGKISSLRLVVRFQSIFDRLIVPTPLPSMGLEILVLLARVLIFLTLATETGRNWMGIPLELSTIDPSAFEEMGLGSGSILWFTHTELLIRFIEAGTIAIGFNTRLSAAVVIWTMANLSFWTQTNGLLAVQVSVAALLTVLVVIGSGRYAIDQFIANNRSVNNKSSWRTGLKNWLKDKNSNNT